MTTTYSGQPARLTHGDIDGSLANLHSLRVRRVYSPAPAEGQKPSPSDSPSCWTFYLKDGNRVSKLFSLSPSGQLELLTDEQSVSPEVMAALMSTVDGLRQRVIPSQPIESQLPVEVQPPKARYSSGQPNVSDEVARRKFHELFGIHPES
ncbi:hypothetical protein CMO83_03125 [Candidatus Woesearchaeota archaeon]|jgi:hypothetical protein|nr:hypothetical protein [Candidatus Woesearchaeota archaeon]|tara:strand:- start:14050 stop:14499 length:450 start_codon:yes stop_codon:yes gene_type:complete